MDLAELDREMARIDALLAPIVNVPVDSSDPGWEERMRNWEPLDEVGVRDRAELVLRAIVDCYAAGPEPIRAAIRAMLQWYHSFEWAVHLPREWSTAEEFRDHLIHLSACDQGTDTRDEILTLHWLCTKAIQAGIDVAPILAEVAAMSSSVDRYGMGSTRDILLRYGHG